MFKAKYLMMVMAISLSAFSMNAMDSDNKNEGDKAEKRNFYIKKFVEYDIRNVVGDFFNAIWGLYYEETLVEDYKNDPS